MAGLVSIHNGWSIDAEIVRDEAKPINQKPEKLQEKLMTNSIITTSETEEEAEETISEKFQNQYEYWFAALGYSVGYGNIWRFPYICYKNGGAVFLIPYTVSLVLLAMPIYLSDTTFG